MKKDILIVEDEQFLSAALRKKIELIKPDWHIQGELRTIKETVEWINNHPDPALIFLDIQLADGICFSIFEQVDATNKAIVFTTAYDEYAIEAFNTNSIAYLLKPIKTDDLKDVFTKLEKVSQMISNQLTNINNNINYSELAKEIINQENKYRKRVMVLKKDGYNQIAVEKVAYFSIEGKVTMAASFDGKKHLLDFTLSEIENDLKPDLFLRVNRQYIVNINAIEKIENYFNSKLLIKILPHLQPKENIIVSREKNTMVKKWLNS